MIDARPRKEHAAPRIEFWRDGGRDDFWHFDRAAGPKGRDFPCAEAWDCISRHVYTALQGDSIMHRWTADDRQMVACCNDGTRPVVFLIEREDLPNTPEEEALLAEGLAGPGAMRASINWSRVFPTGSEDESIEAGLVFYDRLIDAMLANGMEPFITVRTKFILDK